MEKENPEILQEETVQDNEASEKNAKKSKVRTLLIFGLALFLIVGGICAAVWGYVNGILGDVNFEEGHEGAYTVSFVDLPDEGSDLLEGVEYVETSEEDLAGSISSETVDEEKLYSEEGTTNILLLGIDSREKGGHARSDAIILLSVNRNAEKLVLTSIMRDTAVVFDDVGRMDKLTHGYAYGGAPLVVDTVETCFGIEIDQYVVIDFYAFIDVVDYLGGVEVDITESERVVMNFYIQELNKYTGEQQDDGKLWETGENILLNGKQTLGYVRNRQSGGTADFGRTERQRIVLSKIIDKIKESPARAAGLLEVIAPQITTDYEKYELVFEALNLAEYSQYAVEQNRVPADDTWHYCSVNGRSLVACDYEANQRYMLESIYGITLEDDQSE